MTIEGCTEQRTKRSSRLRWLVGDTTKTKEGEVDLAFAALAAHLERLVPEGCEKADGMSKLIEAKSCFQRACFDGPY